MAILTGCRLNLSPTPPGSNHPTSLLPSRTTEVAWQRSKKGMWKGQCVVGMACLIIGVEMGNLISHEKLALAEDLKLVVESKEKVARWSDKRMCPPWQMNSLETIVPENLPRPSAHRRWEAVGYSSRVAPAVKVAVKTGTSCFSM